MTSSLKSVAHDQCMDHYQRLPSQLQSVTPLTDTKLRYLMRWAEGCESLWQHTDPFGLVFPHMSVGLIFSP